MMREMERLADFHLLARPLPHSPVSLTPRRLWMEENLKSANVGDSSKSRVFVHYNVLRMEIA